MQPSPCVINSLSWTCLTLLIALTACEDGPNDNYRPAPPAPRLGKSWNDSRSADFADDAGQEFKTSTAGTNKNDICTPDQVKAARSKYFRAPILPPGLAAGLDIAGGPKGDGAAGFDPDKEFKYDPSTETWTGATVEQAEQILCQGAPDSVFFGDTNTIGWGDNNEVSVEFNANNRLIESILLQTGYEGAIEADSSDGKSHFSIKLNNAPIQRTSKDAKGNLGAPQSVIIKWSDQSSLTQLANDLFDALRNTFQPDFPADSDCVAAGHCIIGNNFSAGGYFWFTPLNMTFFVNTTVGTDTANSAFVLMEIGKLKLLGFSTASTLLKLDANGEGPVAVRNNVWGQGVDCRYRLGMRFDDFRKNCVEPFKDSAKNKTEDNKLFGGVGHSNEAFVFDVEGVDPQFVASSLPDDEIVGDSDRPTDDDTAYQLRVDQQVLGPIANDYTDNDTTKPKDVHGGGLVTLEWANMVQQYMTKKYGVNTQLGDPDCVAMPMRSAKAGKSCSGIEGIVTTAPPAAVSGNMKVNALGSTLLTDPATARAFRALGLGLKPGTWFSLFCTDNGGIGSDGHPVGYKASQHHCYGQDPATHNGYYFETMQYMVQQAYGGAANTPKELTDLRFYFEQWILALIKYLQVADNPSATLALIDMQKVSPDNLFFDTLGGGFEFAEYVDRHAVQNAKQDPTNVRVATNLQTSVINDFTFTRHNFRGEEAIYEALAEPNEQPGSNNVLLSNLTGSSVLVSTYGSYECAINTDPMKCDGTLAPQGDDGQPLLDDDGNLFLSQYADAFGQSAFAIPALGAPSLPSALGIKQVYEDIASAMISLPKWKNPFDPSSASDKDPIITALIPYLPKGAAVGFPVSVDGSRDKFVNTYAADFSGVGLTVNVDFDYTYDKDGSKSLVIKGIETEDFLGKVFVCAEPNPKTMNPDILAVRMYTPSQEILDWFTAHPDGMRDCDVVFKYSIFGNYPDFITARASGVRIGINPGYGGGRVTDVVVFDPNVVAALGE